MKIGEKSLWGLGISLILGYFILGYYTPRFLPITLFALTSLLFLISCLSTRLPEPWVEKIGLILRISFLPALPLLSDDFYRFAWDGLLLVKGVNPYEYLPIEAYHLNLLGEENWLNQMNSAHYPTVYPPVSQAFFGFFGFLAGENLYLGLIGLRLLFIGFDWANYSFLKILLSRYQINPKFAHIYWLHPMVILEFTGNLHFEALMITGLLVFLLFIDGKRKAWSASGLVMGIGVKIIPVLILPFLFRKLPFKDALKISILSIGLVLLISLPFLSSEMLSNWQSGLELYFRQFEFNSSLFRLFKFLGLSGLASYLSLGLILALAILFFSKNTRHRIWPKTIFFILFFQILFSQMAHPWYFLPLFCLGLFTRFPLTSAFAGWVMVLTYTTYAQIPYQQIGAVVFIEYLSVLIMAFAERHIGLREISK